MRVSVKHTLSTNLVDSSQQFSDALVRVDALGDTLQAMAEYEFDDGAVDIGRVKHTGKCMTALMRRMAHAKVTHDGVENCSSERVVAVPSAVSTSADVEPWRLHGLLIPRQELLRYWYKPTSSGVCLAVPDHDDATPQFHVSLADVPILADSAAGVDEHEHVTYFGHFVDTAPKLIALPDGKRLFLVQLLRSVDVKIPRVVFDDKIVPQRVLVELLEQRADFLLRRVSAAGMPHVINDLVKVAESNVHENHRMEAGAMLIRVAVADASCFASEPREVLSLPERVNLGESCLARVQQGRITIILDKVRHGIFEAFKVSNGFLSVLDSLLDDIRPPPIPLQAVDGSKSIWQFHFYHLGTRIAREGIWTKLYRSG